MSISAIIVTYNRSFELLRCVQAVLNQTSKVDSIVIVNNASTDNTLEKLGEFFNISLNAIEYNEKLNFLKSEKDSDIYLICKNENSGGAGGFYSGLKKAHECLKTDYYWLMDDDGYPSNKCLEMLSYFFFDIICSL